MVFQDGFEDKRWSIVLEEVTKTGQRKPLAQAKINLADLVGENSDEKVFKEVQNLELRGYKGEIKIQSGQDNILISRQSTRCETIIAFGGSPAEDW